MALGSAFLGVKVIEYADKFEHHIVPGPYFDKSAWQHPAGVDVQRDDGKQTAGCTSGNRNAV